MTTNSAYRGDGLGNSRTVGMNTTTFTWDIASGLPVVLDDGNQYVYGAGLTAMKQSGNWYYYLADGLGSTMAVVDSSGNSQKSYQYDVYGEVTGGSGSLPNEFDFAGQQTDATGLQYLRARYYDPETGTFMSRDPLARRPAWLGNSTGYGNADAVRFRDPAGTRPCDEETCWSAQIPPENMPPSSAGPDFPDGNVYNPPPSVYAVCDAVDYYQYDPCRALLDDDNNIFLDVRDSVLIANAKALLGEYGHKALVDCVRDAVCRMIGDGIFNTKTVLSLELAAYLKYVRYATVLGVLASQTWAAYERRFGRAD